MFYSILAMILVSTFTFNVCVQQSTFHQRISKFAPSITLADIVNLNINQIRSAYASVGTINKYKVQIEDKYNMTVGDYLETNQNGDESLHPLGQGYACNAEHDIWLKFSDRLVTISCRQAWAAKLNCGTFIEIHLPFDQSPLIKLEVQNLTSILNVSIEGLCAGPYHIWLIYSTRVGQIIKAVVPFLVAYPFCSC